MTTGEDQGLGPAEQGLTGEDQALVAAGTPAESQAAGGWSHVHEYRFLRHQSLFRDEGGRGKQFQADVFYCAVCLDYEVRDPEQALEEKGLKVRISTSGVPSPPPQDLDPSAGSR